MIQGEPERIVVTVVTVYLWGYDSKFPEERQCILKGRGAASMGAMDSSCSNGLIVSLLDPSLMFYDINNDNVEAFETSNQKPIGTGSRRYIR